MGQAERTLLTVRQDNVSLNSAFIWFEVINELQKRRKMMDLYLFAIFGMRPGSFSPPQTSPLTLKFVMECLLIFKYFAMCEILHRSWNKASILSICNRSRYFPSAMAYRLKDKLNLHQALLNILSILLLTKMKNIRDKSSDYKNWQQIF